jgi:hypothetical protein
MATAICSTPPPTQGYQPDQLTSTLQLKFYNNLAEVLSRILEAYYISTTNLQHMYMLAIDTKLPTAGGFKTTADLCKAIKAQMPLNVPSYSFTQPSSFQIFLETNLENSLLATNAYTQLSKLVQALCLKEENKPQLANINHALVAMNINIQTHIMAVHKHMMSTTTLQFPKAFAILITEKTTGQDVYQYLKLISTLELPDEETSFMFTLIENEKINAINFLSSYLPDNVELPVPLHISTQYSYSKKSPPPTKLYQQHQELATKYQAPKAPQKALIKPYYYSQGDALVVTHPVPAIIQPTLSSQSVLTLEERRKLWEKMPSPKLKMTVKRDPEKYMSHLQNTFNNGLSNRNDIPTPSTRQKRSKWADFWAGVTGLATQDAVKTLDDNEGEIANAERKIQEEMTTILAKTNSIVSSFTDQADKMSKLYQTESEPKDALKNVLRDEKDTMAKLNNIVVSIEILSDVQIEFSSFQMC